jgi:DGQHR domain-containing protein
MTANNFDTYSSKAIKTDFDGTVVYTFQMKVKDVITLSYVAVRGKDKEEGAVQRPLNRKRISDIKEYVLGGKIFFNTFILNWTDENEDINYENGSVTVPLVPDSAQVIDGQHRIAGLEEAINEDESIGDKLILVTMGVRFTTEKAAEIFLNINTEQKPVPKSLIYDLFGIVETDKEHSIVRAKDIADELNLNTVSPYYNLIKYPGSPRGAGAIGLSTVVSTFKKYLGTDTLFDKYGIKSFEVQKQIILNYYSAIQHFYKKRGLWLNKRKNPFMKSAGFVGAWEFFIEDLFMKCIDRKSFSKDTFIEFLNLDEIGLLYHEEIKGLDGKSARLKVKDYLSTNLILDTPKQDEFEI